MELFGPAWAMRIAVAVIVFSASAVSVASQAWPERLSGHGGPVKSVVLSSDGRRALTSSFDYTVVLWSIDGSEARIRHRMVGHEAAANDARFVSAGRAVSVGDDGAVILWNLESGEMLSRVDTGGDKILSLTVSPSGDRVATASWDRTVRVYALDGDRLEERAVLAGHRGNVNSVVFSDEGDTVFSAASDGVIRAFDANTGELQQEVHSHGWGVNTLLRTGDDGQVVFGAVDGVLAVLDTTSGEITETLPGHSRPVLALARSADGRFYASGGGDGRIQVFDAGTHKLVESYETPFGPVWGLALNENASVALHAGLDDFVKVWRIAPRRPFEPADGVYPRRFQASSELEPGERQFARKCSVCHTLTPNDGNRAGPTLYAVFGRRAGSLPEYPYSQALLDADLVWNEKTISDLFDHGPDVVTPGSKMPIQRLKNEAERTALVAFLKQATAPHERSAPSLERMPTR